MRPPIALVHDLISGLETGDALEAEHRLDSLRWLETTDDVFRRLKPATSARHLVSYVVPVDPDGGGVLLVDHVNAGLWLPPGGHVEPDEHPALAARREAWEELGIDAVGRLCDRPAFLTITRTIGVDHGHTDVSLWFLLSADRTQPLVLDTAEFRSARWWSPTDVSGADPATFDPHFARFLAKVGRSANEVRAASAGRPEDGTAVAGASDQVATPT